MSVNDAAELMTVNGLSLTYGQVGQMQEVGLLGKGDAMSPATVAHVVQKLIDERLGMLAKEKAEKETWITVKITDRFRDALVKLGWCSRADSGDRDALALAADAVLSHALLEALLSSSTGSRSDEGKAPPSAKSCWTMMRSGHFNIWVTSRPAKEWMRAASRSPRACCCIIPYWRPLTMRTRPWTAASQYASDWSQSF